MCFNSLLVLVRGGTFKDPVDPYFSISDFIAPKETGVKDYIGLFVTSIFGAEDLVKKYEECVSKRNYRNVGASRILSPDARIL